jgi:hypothetical protein
MFERWRGFEPWMHEPMNEAPASYCTTAGVNARREILLAKPQEADALYHGAASRGVHLFRPHVFECDPGKQNRIARKDVETEWHLFGQLIDGSFLRQPANAEAVIVGVVSYPSVIVVSKTFQAGVD